MAERRVAEVVPHADRLGQVLVQPQRAGHRAGDAARLERVGEPRAVVVALGGDVHLRLVLEAAEGLAVDDAVAVALEGRADGRVGLRLRADRGIRALRQRGQERVLESGGALLETATRRPRLRHGPILAG